MIVGTYGGRLYHDPASGWVFPGGVRADPPRGLQYAMTLEPKDTECSERP